MTLTRQQDYTATRRRRVLAAVKDKPRTTLAIAHIAGVGVHTAWTDLVLLERRGKVVGDRDGKDCTWKRRKVSNKR